MNRFTALKQGEGNLTQAMKNWRKWGVVDAGEDED